MLFGSDGVSYKDVEQGSVGDCWWMASMQAVALAGKIESNFLNRGASEAGVYAVKLYPLGVPVHITVDDQLPYYYSSSRGRYYPVYARYGENDKTWSMVMESAFAKLHGNYSRIEGGISSYGVSYLNGSPFEYFYPDNTTEQGYWDYVIDKMDNNGLILAGTPCDNGGDNTTNDNGLVNCHQYSLIDHAILPNGQKLLKIRNPWGQENYYGPYSDYGDLSDTDLDWLNDNGHPHTKRDDGEFWIRSEDFYAFTDILTNNPDVEALGWHHAWHLTIDDDGTGGAPGEWYWCGENCTRYIGTVTNDADVTNTIHAGMHTWMRRTYGSTSTGTSSCY